MSREHIVIDDTSVRESIPLLEQSEILLNSALKEIESSKNNLDYKIKYKIGGYSDVKLKLNDAIQLTKSIIKKSKNYLEIYEEKLSSAKTMMSQTTSANFSLSNSQQLSLETKNTGTSKVSSVYISDNGVSESKVNSAIQSLHDSGFTDEDINRLINGEISLSDLMLEIANDKDRTRYKKLFEKKTLGNYKYSYKETSKVLDEAKARQGELDKALRETEFTIINPNSSQEEVAIAKKKAQEITAQIKENNELIVSCTNSINTYGEMEYSFSSMAELEGEISKIEAQLKSLIDEYNRQEAANKFKDYFHYLVFRIDNGDKGTYSEVMNTTIAYEYIDINGNKVIAFTKEQNGQLIKPNGVPEDAKPLTYLDVYGNLDAVLAPRSDESEEDYDARIKSQFTSYESPNNDTSGLLAQINKLNHDKAVYTNIHTYASETINYQMMLDTYINQDNFEENCTFNGNFDDFKTLERRLDIDAKVETMDIDTYTGWVLSNVINGKDEVKNDYAAQLSFNIKGFEIMTSHKELAVNFNEKWRHIMTDDEIAVFNYICNTEGYAAGYKFLESIKNDLDMRWVAQKRATDTKFAGENPVLASIESVFIKPVESVGGALYSLYHVLKGLDMARSNIYSRGDTYRNKVSMNLNILNGEGAAFLYNVVMSMADSALTIALTTATGGGNLLWSTTVMGSSVYLSTLNDALDKGLDPGKAVLLAIVSAGIESLMESYSVSHFTGLENKMSAFLENGTLMAKLQAKLGGKVSEGAFKSISKMAAFAYCAFTQGLVEGEEEISTEILDNIVDIIISGDASAFINNANQYKSEHYGCSDEEAYAFAWGEHLKQVGLSGLAGFTSGIGFGSFAGVKGSRSVQTIIDSNYLQLLQLLQNNENLSVTTNINSQISQTSNINSDIRLTHQIEGYEAVYSENELKKYTDDKGQVNYTEFFKFLLLNDRFIVNKNGVKKSSLMQTLKDLKEFYLNPNAKIDEMIDILQDLSRRNWEFANQEYFSSHDNLERIIDNTVYFQSIYNVITLLVNNPLYGINNPRFNELVFLAESIKGKIIDSKVVGSFDYNGAKVELIGTNLEFLSKAAIRLKRAIDKLPQVLKNGNITSFKIYDSDVFSRYIGLRGIKRWFSFVAADCGGREIRFFKEGISMTTDLGILDTLVHESGHDFDEYYTSSGYFTEEYPIWKEAKKKDVLWVSLYGETNLFEDFAESVRLYFKNKGLFSALHPNRARVLEAMIDSKNPQSITNTRKLEIMEMFKGNGNLSSEMFHKMFDNDSVKTLTYEEKLKVEAILLYDGIDASDDLYDSMWSN